MTKTRDAACRFKRVAREGTTTVHEADDGALVVCERGREVRRVPAGAKGMGRARVVRGERLISSKEAVARVLARNPQAKLSHLPPWIYPFASYMKNEAPLAKGTLKPRDAIKAYLITKSSVQRGAIGLPKICAAFPGFTPREPGVTTARPEDVMAELLLSPLGKSFLDDAERGVFNEDAARKIADSFTCFGLVYPAAGTDLSNPATLRKTKQLFLADLRRAPRLAAQTDAWCLGQKKRAKTFSTKGQGTTTALVRRECFGDEVQAKQAAERKCEGAPAGKCAWTTIPPISAALTNPDPEVYFRWAQANLPGISSAKVGFFASLLGRGDIPTFDAREIKLWFPEGEGAPKWEDVEELRDKIAEFPMKLPSAYEPFRSHLVHHALWDQFPARKGDVPTQTSHEELVEAMQFAGPKKPRKPKRRDAVAVAAHVAQVKRGGAHTDKRDRRSKQKRAWRENLEE